ncbi:MAG: DUF4160 domain-containing protein [Mesorhizobium sp.]|nr:DUF4160 domain-containing protein [Mesorhizobium sp.]
MPTVAVVDGAKIQVFASEHPPPHFHVASGGYRAQIAIDPLRLLNGYLPPAKLSTVLSWVSTRQAALMAAWNAIAEHRLPGRIE